VDRSRRQRHHRTNEGGAAEKVACVDEGTRGGGAACPENALAKNCNSCSFGVPAHPGANPNKGVADNANPSRGHYPSAEMRAAIITRNEEVSHNS
jgi:hypothetical protein